MCQCSAQHAADVVLPNSSSSLSPAIASYTVGQSFLLERSHAILNPLHGARWTFRSQYSIFLPTQLVIVHEEIFQFLQKGFAQILDVMNIRKAVIFFLHSHDAIIPLKFLLLTLFALDDSNDPALQHAAGESGLVHQHQNIRRVTVISERGWHKTKIVGKFHPCREDFL